MGSLFNIRGLGPRPILPTFTSGLRMAFPQSTATPAITSLLPSLRTYAAKASPGTRKKKRQQASLRGPTESERKLKALKTNLFANPPPPLRMGRNRHLRHWTIHRAWLLHQRSLREDRDRELLRMRQGMAAACEELRMSSGPGTRPEGYLYRLAMEKKGVYGGDAIPIEYARLQTETPAREAWDYGWTK